MFFFHFSILLLTLILQQNPPTTDTSLTHLPSPTTTYRELRQAQRVDTSCHLPPPPAVSYGSQVFFFFFSFAFTDFYLRTFTLEWTKDVSTITYHLQRRRVCFFLFPSFNLTMFILYSSDGRPWRKALHVFISPGNR